MSDRSYSQKDFQGFDTLDTHVSLREKNEFISDRAFQVDDRVRVITGGKFKDRMGRVESYDPTDQTYRVRFADGGGGDWQAKQLKVEP
ncbi:MAG: hypothetical protein KME35_15245 [Aphanocapsa sp. GSE-SYN-MK-11-07L]|nr:hypothetical protein [Aphanocapsa sp. GSE-SYN-MK-11-07L]